MKMEKDESGRTLRLSGELEIGSAEELHAALRDHLAGAVDPRIDLSRVSHCDTAALQLLCSACRTARPSLEFTGVSDAVREACVALGLSLTAPLPEEAADHVV